MEGHTSPRTPRSKGRGLWNSYKGLIVDSYPETGSVGSFILPSPGSIILPSQTSRDSSRRLLKRALQFAIPEKFKQTLSHRSENHNQVVKTPTDDLKPIGQKSFYGSSKDQIFSPRPSKDQIFSPRPSKDQIFSPRPSYHSESSDEESPSKKPLSEPAKPTVAKRSISNSLHQLAAKSKIIKRKKFGMNKGVQHAIRKPNKKAIRLKTLKQAAKNQKIKKVLKKRLSVKRLCKANPNLEGENSTPVKNAPKLEEKPKKTGKIQVAERDNVKYEIKNGMPVFIIRRSPRKKMMSPIKSSNAFTRKTPAKLFNPSGATDYLMGSPVRKRLGPCLPSPVKFIPLECENDEDIIVTKTGEIIQEIIESLDESQSPMECIEYNHFVSEDDYATLAAETAIQMENLNTEDELVIESSVPNLNETSGEGSERYQKLKDKLRSIVSEIPPPTDEEMNEGKMSKESELSATEQTSEKLEGPTPVKVFPIFEKGFSPRTDTKSPARKSHLGRMNGCLTQTVIDAGQSQVGVNHCTVCDFIYTVGVKDEEQLHSEKHNFVTGVIKFAGWKTERNLKEFEDGKIIAVFPDDDKRHWTKVKDVLTVVDNQLGISSDDTPVRDLSKAYLFVTDGCVAGFLLAEHINKDDSVSLASVKEGEMPVLHKIRESLLKRVLVGISRIWVADKFQRKKIATRLVDTMRSSFVSGKHLKASEFAFSHTTTSGSSFATKYLKQPNFVTYTTLLDNNPQS